MIRAAGLPDNERARGLAGRALTHARCGSS